MKVIVTGGAGYIGSHTVRALVGAGHQVAIIDDLSTGHGASVDGFTLIQCDITDEEALRHALEKAFDGARPDALMHFAAKSLVGESMQHPAKYYVNNVAGGVTLLEQARAAGVKHVVFSSTAAVYGEPEQVPIAEDHPLQPTSVYGRTKLMFEDMLADYEAVYGISYASLRYFNAAGADASGDIGEDHDPETHLIPIVMQAALGQRESVTMFGTDYPTPDGTCIRDYIHVTDLADAHVLALQALADGAPSDAYNLGNGQGFSVRELIETVKKVTGRSFTVEEGPRRPGDPAVLIAAANKAMERLGWQPKLADLEAIIQSAWHWHSRHPNGYKD